jgi:hypothetical protein
MKTRTSRRAPDYIHSRGGLHGVFDGIHADSTDLVLGSLLDVTRTHFLDPALNLHGIVLAMLKTSKP